MHRSRSTKIVATLGPATSTEERIRAIFAAGVDVFRLNFSHGTVEDHRARVDIIRALEAEFGRPIGILADLQGPKIRVGTFVGDRAHLTPGQAFRLDMTKEPGTAKRAPLPHPEIFQAIQVGNA